MADSRMIASGAEGSLVSLGATCPALRRVRIPAQMGNDRRARMLITNEKCSRECTVVAFTRDPNRLSIA